MRQHRATVLGIGLLVSVSLAGCVGDATKSASDTPASTPIASVGSDTVPPVVEGPPSPPPEAGEVQERGVALAGWQITNGVSEIFAGLAAQPTVLPLTGDFDGDGRMDVALLNRAAGWATMPVAFANGDGTWRITNTSSGGFAGWAATTTTVGDRFGNNRVTRNSASVLTGDFDGDKHTDVALLNQDKDVGWLSMPVAFWHDTVVPQTTIKNPISTLTR